MISPTKDEVRALVNLKSAGKDFEVVMRWIHNSMVQQSLDNNQQRNETEYRLIQGRNIELSEILEHYKEAENTLRDIQKPQPSTPS